METIGSKRSYALTWCMLNNDDDDDDNTNYIMLLCLVVSLGLNAILLPTTSDFIIYISINR